MRREWKYRFRRFACAKLATEVAAGERRDIGVMASIGSANGEGEIGREGDSRGPSGLVKMIEGLDSRLDGVKMASPARISSVRREGILARLKWLNIKPEGYKWVNSVVAVGLKNPNNLSTPGILQIVNLLLPRIAADEP